ncbi:hypothetical protein CEXT_467171 [Caerostris extrusa]|uniref:Uncharacterized protein n=1 Tax=Caerostris extrusa TaxID=172846 RepID=A0AAV4WGY5_CAEEX|nr:hypothetical protein CEXT_467171 [Caerostris extrusa]
MQQDNPCSFRFTSKRINQNCNEFPAHQSPTLKRAMQTLLCSAAKSSPDFSLTVADAADPSESECANCEQHIQL